MITFAALPTAILLHFLGLTSEAFAFTESSRQRHALMSRRQRPPKITEPTNAVFSSAESSDSDTLIEQETIDETYQKLADQAVQTYRESGSDRRLWIGVVGAPGSGKTTIAQNLVERINKLGLKAICIPMDGYHFTQKEMKEKGYDMKRRGAAWTFDATLMYEQLKLARERGRVVAYLPDYSRDISDPIPGKIKLEESHDIVIIEGLYLILGSLCQELDDADSPTIKVAKELGDESWIREELKRWEPLMQLWDQTFFVEPPFGFEENKRRLVERSLKTWTPEKT